MPIIPRAHETIGQSALRNYLSREGISEEGREILAPESGPRQPAVVVEHIRVLKDRIVATIRVANQQCAITTPALINEVLEAYPFILSHSCVNEYGETFEAVAKGTSLPHLIEHMVIEGQARSSSKKDAAKVFVGKSYWSDKVNLVGTVEVNYANDLVALAALKEAVDYLNKIMILQ